MATKVSAAHDRDTGSTELNAQLRRIDEVLRTLPTKVANKVVIASLRAGGMKMVHATRSRVPVRTSVLAQSIRMRASTKNKTVVVLAGGRGRFGDAYYAHFVEFGTKRHVINAGKSKALALIGVRHPVRSVVHPGAEEKPFMRPAFDSEADATIEEIAKVARQQLAEALR